MAELGKSYDQLQTELLILRQTFHALETEYDNALADAERRLKTMEALKYNSLQLAASMNLEEMLEDMLQVVFELFLADNAHIFLYDGENLDFCAMVEDGKPGREPFSFPRPHGLTYAAATSGHYVVVEDVRNEPLLQELNLLRFASMVLIPMKVGEQVIGVMNIGFKKRHHFSGEELGTLELFAHQTAIAVENVRLYKQSQQATAEVIAAREQEKAYYEELNRTKDLLMDMVSHDVRNPIGIIKGYTNLLREHGQVNDELGQHCLEQIDSGAARILSLVTDLLDLAKLETGLGIKPAPVALNQMLSRIVTDFELPAKEKSIVVHLDLPTEELTLTLDRSRMEQVLANLVSNAIKYTPQGGSVSLSAHQEAQELAIRVTDTGYGIAPDEISKLFRKFYRISNPDHSDVEGTGLGLVIAKTIVEQHGGTILVESTLGQGSTFIIRVPV